MKLSKSQNHKPEDYNSKIWGGFFTSLTPEFAQNYDNYNLEEGKAHFDKPVECPFDFKDSIKNSDYINWLFKILPEKRDEIIEEIESWDNNFEDVMKGNSSKIVYSLHNSLHQFIFSKYDAVFATEENYKILILKDVSQFEVIHKYPSRAERKYLVGKCTEVGMSGDLPWSDATEMAQDLGYWATFSRFDDPEDSNYREITEEEFALNCHWNTKKQHFIFLKNEDESIFIAYDEDKDIHYIYT